MLLVTWRCQTHVASACKMSPHGILPHFHFCSWLGHCELSLHVYSKYQKYVGTASTYLKTSYCSWFSSLCCSFSFPLLYVLIVFYLLFLQLYCLFHWFLAQSLEVTLRSCLSRNACIVFLDCSRQGRHYPIGCLCAKWKKCVPFSEEMQPYTGVHGLVSRRQTDFKTKSIVHSCAMNGEVQLCLEKSP